MQGGTGVQHHRVMNARSRVREPWWAESTGGDVQWCAVCGAELDDDGPVTPAAPPGRLCSECALAREFDETLWEADLADPDAGLW